MGILLVAWWLACRCVSAHVGYGLFLLPLLPLVVPALGVLPNRIASPVHVAPIVEVSPVVVNATAWNVFALQVAR